MISSIESGYEMVAVERMKSSEKIQDVIAVELVVTQQRRSMLISSQ